LRSWPGGLSWTQDRPSVSARHGVATVPAAGAGGDGAHDACRVSADPGYQPSLDKMQVQTLSTCHFIEHGENLVILGPPESATIVPTSLCA
jgi:hypothetical protein